MKWRSSLPSKSQAYVISTTAPGHDAKGRKQYRYHPLCITCRDEVKYSNLVEFARALPSLRKRIEKDMKFRGLPRERVLASVVCCSITH
jgi:DNA topoisomerase-1